jgi:hypothetical protein
MNRILVQDNSYNNMRERLKYERIANAITRRIRELYHTISWFSSRNGLRAQNEIVTYKNTQKGKKLFLIANGPSLKEMDLNVLKDHRVMVMNRFYMMFDQLDFIPDYLVCVEETVLNQFSNDLAHIPCTTFFNWRTRDLFPNSLFLKESYAINPFFQYELTKPTQFGGTVTYACLQLAYYMGFREVVIIGLDHSFKEKGTPATTEIRTSDKDESHFHPDYFPKGMKWVLPDLEKSEYSYQLARNAFEADSRRIIDCTLNGKCDVFEKGSLGDFIQ